MTLRWRLIGLFRGDADACTYFKIQLTEVALWFDEYFSEIQRNNA